MGARWAAIAALVLSVAAATGCAGSASTGSATDGSEVTPAAAGQCGGPAGDLNSALRIMTDPMGCPGAVNTLWRRELGNAWTPVRFVPYRDGEVPNDACGARSPNADDFADNALYCRLDDTVAYSVDFMAELYQQGGPTYPMFVLMHEIGHRANRVADAVGVVSRAEENQADCVAGHEAKFAHDAGRLPLRDVFGGALLFYNLGDTRGHGWFDREAAAADAHGTPRQRAQAFSFGYLRSLEVCRRLGRSPTGSVLF
jgi:predicted metalloprotease